MAVNKLAVQHERKKMALKSQILGHKVAIATHKENLQRKRAELSSMGSKASTRV